MSNLEERAADIERRAQEAAKLPMFKKAAAIEGIALDSARLVRDLARAVDAMQGVKHGR